MPNVQPVRTARYRWHQLSFDFTEDASLARLEQRMSELMGIRSGQDLLQLELQGTLGIGATTRLESLLESCQARLLRLKLSNCTIVAPSADEVESLTRRASDPLISRVASHLVAQAAATGEDALLAGVALRELYAFCNQGSS
jgi:hypothetical protein